MCTFPMYNVQIVGQLIFYILFCRNFVEIDIIWCLKTAIISPELLVRFFAAGIEIIYTLYTGPTKLEQDDDCSTEVMILDSPRNLNHSLNGAVKAHLN